MICYVCLLGNKTFVKSLNKESLYFTETSCQESNGQLIYTTFCGVRLSLNKHYVKENKAILKNSFEDKKP